MRTLCSAPVSRLQDTASAASSRCDRHTMQHSAAHGSKLKYHTTKFNRMMCSGGPAACCAATCNSHQQADTSRIGRSNCSSWAAEYCTAGSAGRSCSPSGRGEQQEQQRAADLQLLPMAAKAQPPPLTVVVAQPQLMTAAATCCCSDSPDVAASVIRLWWLSR